jgi:hypothetical protein
MSSATPIEPPAPQEPFIAATPAPAVETTGVPGRPYVGTAAATRVCANCGTLLTGKYCGACGQRHHDHPVHDFWHFIHEATEDLTHADSRLWQTLIALLFRPGFLTREFLEGRRARYLPPVRLYLVVSVIFFVLGGLSTRLSSPQAVFTNNGKFQYQLVTADQARRSGAAGQTPSRVAGGLAVVPPAPAVVQALCGQSAQYIEQHGGWFASLGPRVAQNCLAAGAEGGLQRLSEAVSHNLERAMFLFLPLLALLMKPLYRKPPRYYVEHLLFFLHNHAFLFAILAVSTLLKMITSAAIVLNPIGTAIAIYIPIYFYRAMRRVYGQSRWLTLSKLATLGVMYSFFGVLMIAVTASYSFLTL